MNSKQLSKRKCSIMHASVLSAASFLWLWVCIPVPVDHQEYRGATLTDTYDGSLMVGMFESDNLIDPADEVGEYMLITVDRDNIVLSADYGAVVMGYMLTYAEHIVQE